MSTACGMVGPETASNSSTLVMKFPNPEKGLSRLVMVSSASLQKTIDPSTFTVNCDGVRTQTAGMQFRPFTVISLDITY